MVIINPKERRSHIRFKVYNSKATILHGDDAKQDVTLDEVSNGGCFLKTEKLLKISSTLSIQFYLPGDLGTVTYTGKVVHAKWRGKDLGMGIQFQNNSESYLKIWEAYVLYLRNKAITTVAARIVDEFYPKTGSKK